MMAAEGSADHVEQTFRTDGDGLDLDGVCQAIEVSVDEIFAKLVQTSNPG